MNGIEYSAMANLILNKQQIHNHYHNQQYQPNGGSLKTKPPSGPIESINSINSDYYSSSNPADFDPTSFANQFATATNANQRSKSAVDLMHRLQTMIEPPEYLSPSLNYKSYGGRQNVTTTKNKGQAVVGRNYTDDFILVSEFSEIEGPRPLLTIPTDGATGFNKNDYSLHLMCVDFHSHLNSQPSALGGSKFGLTKDTSIVNYWDFNAQMVCACVQHFNLYDLEARGFVRPFCLAYVSFDQTPVSFFQQLRAKFAEITNLFKRSNLNYFKRELEQRLVDLAYTREFFLKWVHLNSTERDSSAREHNLDARTIGRLNASSLNDSAQSSQLNAIDGLIVEMNSVLNVVLDELKAKNWMHRRTNEAFTGKTNANHTKESNYQNQETQNITNGKSVSAIDPIMTAFDNDHGNDGHMDNRFNYNRSFTYPFDPNSELTIKIGEEAGPSKKSYKRGLKKAHIYPPVLISNTVNFNLDSVTTNMKTASKRMKRLHQLCENTARKAINELRLMHRHFSMPSYLLKYNELTKSSHKPHSNLFWSITMGDMALVDFSTNLDTLNLNKSTLMQQPNSPHKNTSSATNAVRRPSPSGVNKTNNSRRKKTTDVTQQKNDDNDNDDADNVEVGTATSQDTQFFSPSQNTQSLQKSSATYYDANTNLEISWQNVEKYLQHDDEIDSHPTVDNNPVNDDDDDDDQFYSDDEEKAIATATIVSKDYDEDEQEKSTNEYDFVNSLLTLDSQSNPRHKSNLLALSLTSSSAALYYRTLAALKFSSTLSEKLTQLCEFNFEETLKRLVTVHANIMPHLMYSILKGRPVIVISRYCADLGLLQSVLDCLSLFEPNSFYCLNRVINDGCGVSVGGGGNLDELGGVGGDTTPKYTSSPCEQNQQTATPPLAKTRPELKVIFKRRPIKLNDLKYCKLFGLCLMGSKDGQCCSEECNENLGQTNLGVHKHKHYHLGKSASADEDLLLKYIPITIRNYVSILDLDKQTFLGPKYNGSHLPTCLARCKSLQTDSIIYLHLLTHALKFYLKIAFLYQYSILFQPNAAPIASSNNDDSKSIQEQQQQQNHPSTASIGRKTSVQLVSSSSQSLQSSRRERILRFYSLSNHTEATPAASLGSSIASIFISSPDPNKPPTAANQLPHNKFSSSSDAADIDLLRLILATAGTSQSTTTGTTNLSGSLSLSTNSLTFISPISVQPNTNTTVTTRAVVSHFEHSDLNIVTYLIKSLKIKQVFMYNLAIRKKKLHEMPKQSRRKSLLLSGEIDASETSETYFSDSELQIPLLIDYEELTLFNSKK